MLEPGQFDQFQESGFLLFDPGIPEATIDRAVHGLRPHYLDAGVEHDTPGHPFAFRDDRRIQDAWKHEPAVRAIATAPRVLEVLAALYRRKPFPFQTLNFRVGSEQRTHSDTIHFNSMPSGFMCGVWVALEDVDLENGPVAYYPGTHRWREIEIAHIDAFDDRMRKAKAFTRLRKFAAGCMGRPRDSGADYLKYERVVEEQVWRAGITPVHATVRKGQAFVWASNLLHGGSRRTDRGRTRHSQVTHYFFEGCRYHTPLHKRGRKIAWRSPERIQ